MPTTNSPKADIVPVRVTPVMRRQIDELVAAGHGNQNEVVRTAVQQMYIRERKAMNSNSRFPRIIYASPSDWGNVTEYANAAGMERTIEALADAFNEPFEGELTDCDTYELIQVCNDGSAAYRQQHVRNNKTVAIFKPAEFADYFECVALHDTDYDSEELAELGVAA